MATPKGVELNLGNGDMDCNLSISGWVKLDPDLNEVVLIVSPSWVLLVLDFLCCLFMLFGFLVWSCVLLFLGFSFVGSFSAGCQKESCLLPRADTYSPSFWINPLRPFLVMAPNFDFWSFGRLTFTLG